MGAHLSLETTPLLLLLLLCCVPPVCLCVGCVVVGHAQGALLGWVAVHNEIENGYGVVLPLYIGGVAWTLVYLLSGQY